MGVGVVLIGFIQAPPALLAPPAIQPPANAMYVSHFGCVFWFGVFLFLFLFGGGGGGGGLMKLFNNICSVSLAPGRNHSIVSTVGCRATGCRFDAVEGRVRKLTNSR